MYSDNDNYNNPNILVRDIEFDLFQGGFTKRARFGREEDLDGDIEIMKKKYRGTKDEVLVGHIFDSLKIFKHNLNEYNHYRALKGENVDPIKKLMIEQEKIKKGDYYF